MKLETFVKICELYKEQNEKEIAINKLGVNLIDFIDNFFVIIDILLLEYFGELNVDLIMDYLDGSWDGNIISNNKKEYCINSYEDLYKLVNKEIK